MNSTVIISLLSVLIATLSFITAYLSYQSTRRLWLVSNQGYLDVGIRFILETTPENLHLPFFHPDHRFLGFHIFLDITNIGKIPVEYGVELMTVTLDGIKMWEIKEELVSGSFIYPTQKLDFATDNVKFKDPAPTMTFAEFCDITTIINYKVRYKELGAKNYKYTERSYKVEWVNSGPRYSLISYNDEVFVN